MLIRRVTDILVMAASCSAAYKIRFDDFSLANEYQLPALVFIFSAQLGLNSLGYYEDNSLSRKRRRAAPAFQAIAFAVGLTALFLYLSKSGAEFSRLWFLYSISLSLVALIGVNYAEQFIRSKLEAGTNVILISSASIAENINAKISSTLSEINICKHFKVEDSTQHHQDDMLDEVVQLIEGYRKNDKSPIAEVWIAPESFYDEESLAEITLRLGNCAVNLVWLTKLPIPEAVTPDVSRFKGFVALSSGTHKISYGQRVLKSAFDRLTALLLLTALTPLLVLIALLIKLDSHGPILYRQARYGLNGKEFEIWKFRTMFVTEATEEFRQATKDDLRVTRIGKFLRYSSLDELPQLINVLNGSMSLVGPRPHPNLLNEQYRDLVDRYMARHTMKPGITGLAQISGSRGETPTADAMRERILYDLQYINNWSLLNDIKILFRTLFVLHR